MKNVKRKAFGFAAVAICVFAAAFSGTGNGYFGARKTAFAQMPFYALNPKEIVLRAEFSTDYSSSSQERKHNIALAAKSLDKTPVDVGGEFSFNKAVGSRTEKRGYKVAKIIINGEFTDGVGGGVCQVSTTLYNAVLRAGLKITEYHPHSLAVSYVPPSSDAMVNSGSADLRFINGTDNPVIISAKADGKTLTVKIFGEKNPEKVTVKSVVKGSIPPEYTVVNGCEEYPDLYAGESRIIKYGKSGITSELYIYTETGGKTVKKLVRKDRYAPINGVICEGVKPRPEDGETLPETPTEPTP